jgi:hypothetical protein
MTLSEQKLKARYVTLTHTEAVCAKQKTLPKLTATELHHYRIVVVNSLVISVQHILRKYRSIGELKLKLNLFYCTP